MNRDELHQRIQEAADEFSSQVMSAFGEALQSIVADLTVGLPQQAEAPAKPKKPVERKETKKPRAKAAGAGKSAAKTAKKSSGRLPRRSNKELDKAAARVEELLRKRGEPMRIETINAELGTTTKELMRPIKKLLDTKRIQRKGHRRSTMYFV